MPETGPRPSQFGKYPPRRGPDPDLDATWEQVKSPGYEVHVSSRYYGPGYERGDLTLILGVARWLRDRDRDGPVARSTLHPARGVGQLRLGPMAHPDEQDRSSGRVLPGVRRVGLLVVPNREGEGVLSQGDRRCLSPTRIRPMPPR